MIAAAAATATATAIRVDPCASVVNLFLASVTSAVISSKRVNYF